MAWMTLPIFPSSTTTPGHTVARIASLVTSVPLFRTRCTSVWNAFSGMTMRSPPRTALERALADIEMKLAELVHLDGPVRHGRKRRNEKGTEKSRIRKDLSARRRQTHPTKRRLRRPDARSVAPVVRGAITTFDAGELSARRANESAWPTGEAP